MKPLIIAGALILSTSAAYANLSYNACYSRSSDDKTPEYGTMMSFGMWQGEGYYDVEGVVYPFNNNKDGQSMDDPIKIDNGSVLTPNKTEFPSFSIKDAKGKLTRYACYSLSEPNDGSDKTAYTLIYSYWYWLSWYTY